jgi:hypothetical protein
VVFLWLKSSLKRKTPTSTCRWGKARRRVWAND